MLIYKLCEQEIGSLRKLASILAYCAFEYYMKNVKLFFMITNFEEKGLLWINMSITFHAIKYEEGSVQVLHPHIMGGGGSPGPQGEC